MSTETKTTASGGIGFGGLLTVLFVGLKLTGYIAWSWWWVLSLLWIPLGIVVVFLIIMLIILGITTLATSKR